MNNDLVQRTRKAARRLIKDLGPCHPTSNCALLMMLADEVEQLQAIVDKLPETADGVPTTPGMIVFAESGKTGEVIMAFRTVGLAERPFYSTRKAAEVARDR